MPLEEIAGAAIVVIGRFILWIFIQIIFEILCFDIGRFFLYIISLGQYQKILKNKNDGTLESIIGLIILVLTIIYFTNR